MLDFFENLCYNKYVYNTNLKERKVITRMGALAKIGETTFGKVIKETVIDSFGAIFQMANFQEGDDLEEVIASAKKGTNNSAEAKELENFEKIAVLTDQVLEEKAKKQFIIADSEKDEDGYNKIPDRIGDIEATVSEEKAGINVEAREKGGEQKTRND